MGSDRKNDYVIRAVYRSFVLVSVLSALTATAGMLIDNIIVGQFLGADALGAMGVIGPVGLIFSAFSNICSGGGTARAAQAIGKGDREEVCRIFTVTMLFTLVSGGLLTTIGLLFTPQIAAILGAKGPLQPLAVEYLRGFFLSAIPTILMTALMGFVRIDGSPNLPMLSVLTMTAGNIALDLFMVLALNMGMFGMALATTISYCIASAVGFLHFRKKYNTLKFVKPRRAFSQLRALVVTGAPTAISRICDTIKGMVLNNMLVTAVGVGAVAALNVRSQVNNILGALIVGIGQATLPIAGMFFGEKDRTALKDTLRSTLRTGLFCSVAVGVILCAFPDVFPALLGVKDAATQDMAVRAIRMFALSMPFLAVNTILKNFYQSTEKPGFATLICILQSLLYTVLTAALLIRPMADMGVWVAFLTGEILTLLTVILRIAWKQRKFPIHLEDYMLLADSFGGNPRDRLEISIGNDMQEVMDISSGIHKFARGRAIEERTVNQLSLCIEEMAGNIVKHAFKPGEKKWFDLLIVDRGDSVLIQMRDNGHMFDPVDFQKKQDEEKTGEYTGIRLIRSLSRQFEYRRSIGLNNLIIVLEKPPQP